MVQSRRGFLIDGLALLAGVALAGRPGSGFADDPLAKGQEPAGSTSRLRDPRERHLTNIRQLTFGGQNAEAYFSRDGQRLIFQSTPDGRRCDQIYTMKIDGSDVRMVSTGRGVTTCSFFFPDQTRFIYASTHLAGSDCPLRPDFSRGYVWALHPGYDIFSADLDGGTLVRLTDNPGYDAEGVVSPDGRRIVFTSLREGNLELYLMDAEGGNVRPLTRAKGYNGGPFFSWSGRFIAYRAYHPKTEAEIREFDQNLARNLFRPTWLELFVMDADGSHNRQVTNLGAASFAPFMHVNDRQIIFSSNLDDPARRSFDLYLVSVDGTDLERVTYTGGFNSFPMFSKDGQKLVWASSRNARVPHEFNIFVADWVE